MTERQWQRPDRLEENLDRLEADRTLLQGTVSDFVASLEAERRGNGRRRPEPLISCWGSRLRV